MKRIISLVLIISLLLTVFPSAVFAADDSKAIITVNDVTVTPGSTFSIDVTVQNNPGILGAALEISYDDGLTLTDATAGDAFSYLQMTKPGQFTSPCKFVWDGQECSPEDAKDGVILTLSFQVAEDVTGGTRLGIHLSVPNDDIVDNDLNTVDYETNDGTVTVIDYVPGDVNKDGEVSTKDIITFRRYLVGGYDLDVNDYACNVNRDGKVSTADIISIRRYLAGGYDVTLYPDDRISTVCTHTLEAVARVEPTCTVPGNNAYWHCTKCDAYFSDEAGLHEITQADTVLPAQHTLEAVDRVEPTCTEDGNIAYWHCTKCDAYFSDENGEEEISQASTIISATGHTVVIEDGYPPTEDTPGLTDKHYCEVCGLVLVEPEPIPIPEPNTANITYKLVNASKDPYLAQQPIQNNEQNKSTYVIGEGLVLSNDLTVDGYTFVGWFDSFDDNATQIKEIPDTATKDYTLYAHWTENVYTITYNLYQTPVTSSPSAEQKEYTVSKGNSNLYNPEINNYMFLGWYDNDGVEYTKIPVGTTGNIVLNAYYTSLRNLAVSMVDDNPIIVEDQDSNVVYFTYEIGEIRNIPLNGDKPFWKVQSVAGLSQQVSDTYTTTTTSEQAESVSAIITDMTVESDTWTLSENWNDVITVNETWAEEIGKTVDQCLTEATTSSNTLSVSDQMGGSSYHRAEDGSTVYDYDSKTVTEDKGHQYDASLTGTYSNKLSANLGASTEYGTDSSITASGGYTSEGKATADGWSASGSTSGSASGTASASDKDKYSAGISYENGYEVSAGLKYGYHNNTNTVTKTGSDTVTVNSNIDENTSSWNSSATMTSTNQHSLTQSVRNTLSDIVTTTKGYGKSYSNGGSDTTTQGFSSTSSNTSGTSSTVTYSKLESYTTTTTYSVDGKIEGTYRCILVGKAHVFAVVGYDYNTKSYFTYTFSVMDDTVEEFLDYTPKGGDFTDCEYSCLPFEIPTDVYDYVKDRTAQTSGVTYRTDSINGTAKITGYTGTDSDVIIPAYVSDGKQAYKVTEIASTAFAGKSVRAVVLGEFIESIPAGAFKDCTELEAVIGSFTEIGDEAFAGCVNLTSMCIPSNVVKIGENAFEGANSITVRAINSLCAYGEAIKALPDGVNSTDEEIEAKQKEITQEFIRSVLDSGAQNIVIDLSNIVEGTQLTLNVPEINSVEINGDNRTFVDFSLESNANSTTLKEIRINNTKGVPLTINSDKLTLHKVFVSGNTTSLILKKDGVVLELSQDSSIQSTSQYAVIAKNPVIESLLASGGATGYLSVVGNFGYVNSIQGEENIEVSNGELVLISEEEFEKYIQGSFEITLDANGGVIDVDGNEVETVGITAYCGTPIGTLPTATREGFAFGGWYTEDGTEITAETELSSPDNITVYAHWDPNEYIVSWEEGTGYTISVSRTASPYAEAGEGVLSNPDKVYYGDELAVSYAAKEGYSLGDCGQESIIVEGDVGPGVIYGNATPNSYIYNIVCKSSNGTNLGSTTVTCVFGTTNTISAPEIPGYNTPDPIIITLDSTASNTITFIYTPIDQPASQTMASGDWNVWSIGSTKAGVTFTAYAEYQNRTATSVQVRIKWVNTILVPGSYTIYANPQYFSANIGGTETGTVTITSTGWPKATSTQSVTVCLGWITVPLSATSTSVSISADWWDPEVSGSWSNSIEIPTY